MAATSTEPTRTPIEAFFRPSTRFRDAHANRNHYLPENWTEVELLPGLTIEHVLAKGDVLWEHFRHFARHKFVWFSPSVFISSERFYDGLVYPVVLSLGCDVGGCDGTSNSSVSLCMFVHVRSGMDMAATAVANVTATCDFMVRLLATSDKRDLRISGENNHVPPPISGDAISLFFQECQACLGQVTLHYMALNEDQCRALANTTMSRLDVVVKLSSCRLLNGTAVAGAFLQFCLQSDRGPVELFWCNIDIQIIARALTGTSRVTKLNPYSSVRNDDTNVAVLLAALANNRGLVELDLQHHLISDDNWMILCQSLQAHATLTSLDLNRTSPLMTIPTGGGTMLTDEQKTHRTRLLQEMVQRNTVLHTIVLPERERDEQIYTQEILSRLATNMYRPRVLAVKKTVESLLREKVLGRALDSVKTSPNLVWMFLSENVDACVRSPKALCDRL
jgi:hypothetical protein